MKVLVLSCQTESLLRFRGEMMKSFAEAGCDVIAVGPAPVSAWIDKFKAIGVKYMCVPTDRNGLNIFKDVKTLRGYETVISEVKPDKIFVYQAKAVIYGCIAAKKCGVRDICSLIAGLGYSFIGNSLKRKIFRSLMTIAYKVALKNTSTVIFQNNADREEFIQRGIVLEQQTAIINGSGVNVEHFLPKEQSFEKRKSNDLPLNRKTRFIMVSRLIKDKGVKEYLEAARTLQKDNSDIECALLGAFDTNPSALRKSELDSYVEDGSVKYLGAVEDVAPQLRESDVFVLPSYHEGRPKAVLEAMACGLAIITTDAPGCRECVPNGENGILVPPRNVKALCEAMQRLSKNYDLVKAMGKASREIAEAQYDVRKVNRHIMEIMGISEKTL